MLGPVVLSLGSCNNINIITLCNFWIWIYLSEFEYLDFNFKSVDSPENISMDIFQKLNCLMLSGKHLTVGGSKEG